jgi:adenosylcobinamide-GDP ribazoletransferase
MIAPAPIRGMRAAFVFLTRIPVGGFPYRSEDFAWAAAHAPFVGLVLGAMLGGLDVLLLPLGALPAAFLVMGASLLLTGAFHEDGLADSSDALGGAYDRERVLAILKDSRIGTFGAAALVVSIAGRAALIAQLGRSAAWVLPIVGCSARVAPIWLMAALPYVTPAPDAKSIHVARGGVAQAGAATAWLFAASVAAVYLGWLTPTRSLLLVLSLGLVALLTGWRYKRRLGGITGDFLGATEQVGELVALAVLAWKA